MKILIISQYFWPENFRINDIAIGLKARGHEVTVLTGKPNYPKGQYFEGYSWRKKRKENWNGIEIFRSNLFLRGSGGGISLFLNYFSFAFLASAKIFQIKKRFDKVFVYAPSPITVAIPGIVAKKRFKAASFLWVHDLWPESIRIAGGISNRFVLSLMNRMTKWIYRNTSKILVQSPGFIPYIVNQNVPEKKIVYYPYYAEQFYQVIPRDINASKSFPEGFNLVFAGNIGESQSFETLINAALIVKEKGIPVNWLIFGDGRMKNELVEKIKKVNLANEFRFMGSLPAAEMPKIFSCADGLIVSLKRSDIFSITIPGKLQSYLACGKPLIGSLDGIGAEIIKKANAGFVADAENPEQLADAVMSLYRLPESQRKEMGSNGRQYFEKEFERNLLLERLEQILSE